MNNSIINKLADLYDANITNLNNNAAWNQICAKLGATSNLNTNSALNFIVRQYGYVGVNMDNYSALNYISTKFGATDKFNSQVALEYWYGKEAQDFGLKFDGINDAVLITNTTSLNLTNPEFTMVFLFNPFTNLTVQSICGKGNAGARLYNVTLNGAVLVFGYGTGYSPADYYIQIPYIFTNVTKQIVWVKPDNNAAHGKIYVNGVLTSHTIISNTLITILDGNNGRTMIGDFPDGYFAGVAPFNGIIYDLKIFNTDVSGDALSDLFKGEINSSVTDNCVLNMRFSNKQGFVSTDESGNNNNGALSNYTTPDVTLGNTNKWVDSLGNPVKNL